MFKVKINADMDISKIVQNSSNRTKIVKKISKIHRDVPAGITCLNLTKETP